MQKVDVVLVTVYIGTSAGEEKLKKNYKEINSDKHLWSIIYKSILE